MKDARIKELICKLREGKQEYFGEFYELTKNMVWYIICQTIINKQIAEDIMQESYIAFLISLYKVDEHKNPLSYLLTIAKNRSIDEFRKHAREICVESYDMLGNIELSTENWILDAPLLSLCKKRLTSEEYKILELTVIIGYKRVEVAKMLQQPISTLNRRYHMVLKKVKDLYKEVYNEN